MKLALLYASALLVSACATLPDDSGCVEERKIATNKIATNKIATNKIATNKIATNKIATNGLLSATLPEVALTSAEVTRVVPTDALQDEFVQSVLEYTVACALAPGQALELDIAGEHRVYEGAIGLAPQWASESCDETCQGWVSACLIARTNAHGESVPISLLGEHPGLVPTPEESDTFDEEEATYFGQLFGETKELFACVPEGADAPERTCGEFGASCAIAVLGECDEVCDDAGCRGPDGKLYSQTITVNVSTQASCG
jgi:hypothetical protein